MELKWPAIHSQVFYTFNGVPYLTEPGIILIAQPAVNLKNLKGFLESFDPGLQFHEYLDDPVELAPADQLVKVAGQLCYMSFGPKRSWNHDAQKYLDHIKESGHGSVLEHVNFSFIFYGVSRSFTHECVRHRAGFAFSQVSQRYVSGKVLRFVLRPEYRQSADLERKALWRFEDAANQYEADVQEFMRLQAAGTTLLTGEQKTDLRKKVQQAAREFLPNAAEAPICVTANMRGWRHFCEMRANAAADIQIRGAAVRAYRCLKDVAPFIFSDYATKLLGDGTEAVTTPYRKV